MTTGNTSSFKSEHLKKWLETTCRYLFTDWESLADAVGKALPEPRLDSHGTQDRYISRARGSLLRLVKRTAQHARSPLQELECAFYSQASFIARHPDVPGRLLEWLSQAGDTRIRRRIQKTIGHYESRIYRTIDRARRQGDVRIDIDPHAAAGISIGMIQGLTLRMNVNLRQRELLLREVFENFSPYRAGMA
ncbi:MAG TPA: hypothetical protein VMV54_01230 [Acidocella sp.]|jgi:hypothetical protein|nr:hypothetical protein [Acidocella sp.]HUX30504.1 hypothetical protein [Thiobacillus sp.]